MGIAINTWLCSLSVANSCNVGSGTLVMPNTTTRRATGRASGEIVLNGANITPGNPVDAVKSGMAYLTENRRQTGFTPNFTIEGNIAVTKSVKDARYEGWLAGGGVTYGYQWVLGRHWNAEAAVSVGYEHLRYKKFESPEECAPQVGERSHNYWGPTKLSASIIYIF